MEDTEAIGTQNYELMLVANVDNADQLLSRVEKSIKEANGSGVKVERLDRKTLSYLIKKQTDAIYFVLNFEAEASAVAPIWDKLRLEQEDLLRYLLIKKLDKRIRAKKGKKIQEVQEGKEAEEKSTEKPKVTVAVKTAAKVSKVTKVKKVSKVKSKKAKVTKSAAKKGKQ